MAGFLAFKIILVSIFIPGLFQIALICMAEGSRWSYRHHIYYIGQGIWCGIFPTIAGGVGIASAKKPSKCIIIALMVLSILSALMTIPRLKIDGLGVAMR